MPMWEVSFKTPTRSFLIKGEAATPESAFEQLLDESSRQLAAADVRADAPIAAVVNVDMVLISSKKVVGSSANRDAVIAELMDIYRHRTQSPRRPPAPPAALTAADGDDRERIWDDIMRILADKGVVARDRDPQSSKLLEGWYPDRALRETSTEFYFSRACWRYDNLIPGFVTAGPERSIQISRLWTQVSQDNDDDVDPPGGWTDVAGQWAARYDRRFVVIADLDGQSLLIDTRDGEARGCVSEYSGGFIDAQDVRWPSLDSVLSDIRSALQGHSRFAGRWTAEIAAGKLKWVTAQS